MVNDPYTLIVALDLTGSAQGRLYMDDEHSLAHKQGQYILRSFEYRGGVLKASAVLGTNQDFTAENRIERIVIVGIAHAPERITVLSEGQTRGLTFSFDGSSRVLTIRKPDVAASRDFEIALM